MLSPLGLKLYVRRANSGRDHRNLMYIIKNAYACNAHIKPVSPRASSSDEGTLWCHSPPPGGEGGETFELLSPPTLAAAATTLAGDL